jgi:hypothetical protein
MTVPRANMPCTFSCRARSGDFVTKLPARCELPVAIGGEAPRSEGEMYVRFGSKADIGLAPVDVRFTPESGHC